MNIRATVALASLLAMPAIADAAPKAPSCSRHVRDDVAGGQPALAPDVPGQLTPIPLNAARPTDTGIAKKVAVQSVHARRTANDTIEVASRLVNCSRKPLNVVVRTHFLDADQYPSEPASAWQRLLIEPRAFGTYKELSIGRGEVSYFLIEYRGAGQ